MEAWGKVSGYLQAVIRRTLRRLTVDGGPSVSLFSRGQLCVHLNLTPLGLHGPGSTSKAHLRRSPQPCRLVPETILWSWAVVAAQCLEKRKSCSITGQATALQAWRVAMRCSFLHMRHSRNRTRYYGPTGTNETFGLAAQTRPSAHGDGPKSEQGLHLRSFAVLITATAEVAKRNQEQARQGFVH